MIKKLAVITVLMMFVFVSGFAEEEEEKLISIDFQRVPLRQVLRILSARTDRKLITDTNLAGREIVLSLDDVTADEAINALLNTYGLYYIRQPGTNIYVIRDRQERILIKVSEIFHLKHANASDLTSVLEPNLHQGGSIQADERSNAIIVTDLADNIQKIAELIEQIDTPTPQVLIEAKILEVDMTSVLDFGMDLRDFRHVDTPDSPVYQQHFSPMDVGPTLEVGIIESGFNIDAFITFLQQETEARMLNNPKILVLSNETANIEIIDKVPYRSDVRETDLGRLIYTYDFMDVGVTIEVTPHVNVDGDINMHVAPSHSFQTGQAADGVPIIKESSIETSMTIKDGETAVLGGLIRESSTRDEDKVPILGDIPIIGYLFKRTSRTSERSELTMFITARVVQHPATIK